MKQLRIGDITIDAVIEREGPWRKPVDEIEGFILHEASGGRMIETPAAR